jgi:hypothetical protein
LIENGLRLLGNVSMLSSVASGTRQCVIAAASSERIDLEKKVI